MSTRKLYLGLDVHKDFVQVAVFAQRGSEPVEEARVLNEARHLRRWLRKRAREGAELHGCYEASGAGYVLQRQMEEWGYTCAVCAPSMIPKRSGHQRKHDRWDARELGRHYRDGNLVLIRIPTEAEERVRDLVRCRETLQREILKSRHYVLKFLRRRGWVYRAGTHWTARHWRWLRQRLGEMRGADRVVLGEYLDLLDYKLERRDRLDAEVERWALEPQYADAVARLRCFRGIQTHSAMVLLTEVGDWRRFASPRQLMAYFGLVPREASSGERRRQGSITKAGNSHCRHVLIQAAWSYRRPPRVGRALQVRQRGAPAEAITQAWRAQERVSRLYRRLAVHKPRPVAATGAARELVGFLWAAMQQAEYPAEGEGARAA